MRSATRVSDVSVVSELITVAPQLESAQLVDAVARHGALLKGHFLLQGGAHSEYFVRFARLGQDDGAVAVVARSLIEVSRPFLPSTPVTVLSPESSGAFLGAAVAKLLGATLAVAKIDERRRPMQELRLGGFPSNTPVFVVNDVVTTGRSLETLLQLARVHGAEVAGIGVFATLDANGLKRTLESHQLRGAVVATAAWRPQQAGDSCAGCRERRELLPASELN